MTPNEFYERVDDQVLTRNAAARVFLQPIAAPSILGLYGFAGATFMVAAYMCHWYGNATTNTALFPFVMVFGGVAQFLAAMWAFKARDGMATAVHGTWGSFWIAYGILNMLYIEGKFAEPGLLFPALGYWFIVLAAITWMCFLASFASNAGMVGVTLLLSIAATLEAISRLTGNTVVGIVAGYCFLISAIIAWYTASALMFEEAFGHRVLPVMRARGVGVADGGITLPSGEPGVIRGQ